MLIYLIATTTGLMSLIVIKTLLFLNTSKRLNLRQWFYFNRYDIALSSTNTRDKKVLQNKFSKSILIYILSTTVLFVLLFIK